MQPRRVADAIRARLRRKRPETCDVLRIAAVIGREFEAALLAPALQLEPEQVDQSLHAAVRRQPFG
jgi:predicted ATPase